MCSVLDKGSYAMYVVFDERADEGSCGMSVAFNIGWMKDVMRCALYLVKAQMKSIVFEIHDGLKMFFFTLSYDRLRTVQD